MASSWLHAGWRNTCRKGMMADRAEIGGKEGEETRVDRTLRLQQQLLHYKLEQLWASQYWWDSRGNQQSNVKMQQNSHYYVQEKVSGIQWYDCVPLQFLCWNPVPQVVLRSGGLNPEGSTPWAGLTLRRVQRELVSPGPFCPCGGS